MKRRFTWFLGIGIVLVSVLFGSSSWAVPGLISYQGMVTDKDGVPLHGTFAMRFYLYDALSGGTQLWNPPNGEEQSLLVTEGIYNVQLGSSVPLTDALFTGDTVYLEVRIYNPDTSVWETLTPRQRITSVAYALRAGDAETLGGLDSTALDQSAHVADMGNPHGVNAAQIGAATTSALSSHAANASAHHTKTTSFSELTDQATDAQIPNNITIAYAASAGNADTVDGLHAASFSQVGHTHTGAEITGKVADADKLDGLDSSAFSTSGHNHDGAYVNATGDTMSSGSVGEVLRVTNTGLGRGVYATAGFNAAIEGASTGASNQGVYGTATGASGRGVEGYASGTSGRGIYGTAAGSEGRGVYGYASNTETRTNYGGYFEAEGGGIGVYAKGYGLAGRFDGNVTIVAIDNDDPWLHFSTTLDVHRSRMGAAAMITNSEWIVWPETGYYGIVGEAWLGSSDTQVVGVLGHAQGLGVTVGVKGTADASVSAGPGTKYGGHFKAGGPSARGVYGEATATSGVNYGVHGVSQSPDGYGGFFNGRGYFSGNVGIGTTAPAQKLHVAGMAKFDLPTSPARSIEISTPGGKPGFVGFATNGNRRDIAFRDEGLALAVSDSASLPDWWRGLVIAQTGNVGIGANNTSSHKLYVHGSAAKLDNEHWSVVSDARLKNVERAYEYGLEEVAKLQSVRFRYKEGNALGLPSDDEHVGLVAQEVQEVIPEAVGEDSSGYLTLNGTPIHYAMLNAIKELKGEIEQLKQRIKELESNR